MSNGISGEDSPTRQARTVRRGSLLQIEKRKKDWFTFLMVIKFKVILTSNLHKQMLLEKKRLEAQRLLDLRDAANVVGRAYKAYFLRKMKRLMVRFNKGNGSIQRPMKLLIRSFRSRQAV